MNSCRRANGNHILFTWVSSNLPTFLGGTQVNPFYLTNVPPILASKFLPPPGQQDKLLPSRFEFFHSFPFTKGGKLFTDKFLADYRTGKNTLYTLLGMFRQAVYGRLAGYEDVNDADRLRLDPAMRTVLGERAVEKSGASTSEMGRFETEILSQRETYARF